MSERNVAVEESKRRVGRPRVDVDMRRALELKAQGMGYKRIAREMGLPRTTVFRAIRMMRQTGQ